VSLEHLLLSRNPSQSPSAENGQSHGRIPDVTVLVCPKSLDSRQRYCEQLLRRNVKRLRGGLVFKAHRLLYHSTLGLRVIQKKKKKKKKKKKY